MSICKYACGLAIVFASGIALFAQTTAKNEMELGVQAYKRAQFELAMTHFQAAAALDPQNEQAHSYLATALAQQYIPGVDTPNNKHLGEGAIAEYEKALEINPQSKESVKSIAYLLLEMKKFDEAKSHYWKAIDMDADDAELYYSIGIIDWTVAYGPRMELRSKIGVRPDEQLPVNFPGCWELRDSNLAAVEEGMQMLTKAIELRPDYDDAMAYMNLLYRERADIQCNDSAARTADMAAADHWVDMTMAMKKKKSATRVPNASQ